MNKVVVCKVEPKGKEIQLTTEVEKVKDYKDMQKIVGGLIQLFYIPLEVEGELYDIYLSEEGNYEENLPSISVFRNRELVDLVVGDFFISKTNSEGETVSLSNEEINAIIKTINGMKKLLVFKTVGKAYIPRFVLD